MISFLVCFLVVKVCVFSSVDCFNPILSKEQYNYSRKEMYPRLFDRVEFPSDGVIPLLNRKIFRGKRVSIREHPYVASIRRNVAHYSVGCIVTKNVILTVAHPLINSVLKVRMETQCTYALDCTPRRNPSMIAHLSAQKVRRECVPFCVVCCCINSGVVVGENYADRGSMLLTVILIVVHKFFEPSTLKNDIALLRTFEDITFKGSAKSIPLIHSMASLQGRKAFVTGWGRCDRTGRELCLPRSTRYTPGERMDPMLKTVTFRYFKNSVYCENYEHNDVHLPSGMLCLGIAREENPVARCMAVPGAPLVVGARLIGLLSWGFGCGHAKDLPLIYTNANYYQAWLAHNIKELRGISKVYLVKLFQAKRAAILIKWLTLTRVVPPDTFSKVERMVALRVDKDLAKLSGNVYDIRDYLYNGIHHKHKSRLYKKLRDSLVTNVEIDKTHPDVKKLNDTHRADNSDDSDIDSAMTDTEGMFPGEDSNEEYGG